MFRLSYGMSSAMAFGTSRILATSFANHNQEIVLASTMIDEGREAPRLVTAYPNAEVSRIMIKAH